MPWRGIQDKNGLGPPYFLFDESSGRDYYSLFFRDRFGGRQKPENRSLSPNNRAVNQANNRSVEFIKR